MIPILSAVPPPSASAELYFSEYIEGSSFNKALEITDSNGDAQTLEAAVA